MDNQFFYSDNFILYTISIICFIIIVRLFRINKSLGVINIAIFFFYSSILYYNLFCKSQGGSGLLWWFYLVMLTLIQVLILGIYFCIRYFNKN